MDSYTEKIKQQLYHYKISETEYSLEGKKNEDQIYILNQDNTWKVCQKNTVIGVFFNDTDALDFLYYLVMKKHVPMKKCWW